MSTQKARQRVAPGDWRARWEVVLQAPRVILLGLLILAALGIYGWRLWDLQFVHGEEYREKATRQSTRAITVPAARGIVYDRSGVPLVRNVPSFNVAVVPGYLPDDDEAEDVLIRLAILLDMPYATSPPRDEMDEPSPGVREIVAEAGFTYRPVAVKKGVDRDTALLVAQQALLMPGVLVDVESARDYPYGLLVSQMLGYALPIPEEAEEDYESLGYDSATDRIGVAGVEATYEESLRGHKGERIVEEDVLGQVIRVVSELAEPVPGENVHLTIDLDLQRFTEDMLQNAMIKPNVNAPRGVASVMNPPTGEILAMVSLPTYDNNLFTHGISVLDWERLATDPHRPLLNHAISDRLPPGSVFKIVVAAGALQEEVLHDRFTHLNCPGKIDILEKYAINDPGYERPFWCWQKSGHGSLDVVGGIAHSCDVFFYKAGGGFEEIDFEGLGVSRIAQYATLFGFGEATGLELPAEIDGLVPTADWKRLTYGESWSIGDTYNLSIGQGFLEVTPLQMLGAVNVVANSGTLVRPRIVHHVADAEGNVTQPFEPEIVRTVPVSQEHWSLIQMGMEGAVDYGTSTRAQLEGVRVFGKTGTAQFCDNIKCGTPGEYDQPEHAWFAAYAFREEAEAAEVSVIVFLYDGGEGSVAAVPVAHDILEHYFGLDEVEEIEETEKVDETPSG